MRLFMALFLLGIPSGAAVLHSLKYFQTTSSQVPNFPEYVVVALVDEVVIEHYDSNTRRFVPKQDWAQKMSQDDPTYWERETEREMGVHQVSKANLEVLRQRFNRTEGLHMVQRMYGCEWDDETNEVNGFNQHGFDGEDFLVLDLKTETWVAPVPQAVITKHKWDNNRVLMALLKNYFTQRCPDDLKKYVKLGEKVLMRKELPSVSLLQKTPSSPVSCHATGFYPDRADLFWRRDDEELHEGVDKGEILPNHDGTFQMSVDLDLSSVPAADWGRFHCVFQLDGVPEDVLTPLDRGSIRTNWRRKRSSSDEGFPIGTIAGGVGTMVGLLILAGCIYGVVRCRRSGKCDSSSLSSCCSGFRRTDTSESSSSSGGDPAVTKRSPEEQHMLTIPAGQ